ncbi:VOC family protein [Flavobacterium sp. NKUCC04_CG]|uniref:VOC family protein n=1 Tax=Flavobacterium sp. NKUCC04_CG TaxID=2842121 RepID=UPI001C5AE5FD|nr:VOC family protein [Flavobacterium sp. NKUCC04_CG]MBW3519950.1 VOC family protein [Flavobacterium sp. NKUCC04_CG]
MATTNTYLNFKGNCEEAFLFYKAVFGGEFNYIGRFGDMPASDDYQVADSDKDKIMHVSLPIGTSILMGSDTGGAWAPAFVQGNNFSVSVSAESKAEADAIFKALADGGKITMPLENTFWGDYFGMLTDKFNINWMMSFDGKNK